MLDYDYSYKYPWTCSARAEKKVDVKTDEDAFKFMVCEHGRMLAEVNRLNEASWPEVAAAMYPGCVPRNFDQFKYLIQHGFITQTDETRSTRTKAGKLKFKSDSLSAHAKYECTAKGNSVVERVSAYPNALAVCRQYKDFRKSRSTVEEYALNKALNGNDCIFDEEFIRDRVMPEIANAPGPIVDIVTAKLDKIYCQGR